MADDVPYPPLLRGVELKFRSCCGCPNASWRDRSAAESSSVFQKIAAECDSLSVREVPKHIEMIRC